MNIAAVDLNLLRIFDALIAERSVTRAGERVGLSQPAVSSALNRLRHIMADQLFVREGNFMVPTPRALALEPVVRDALSRIDKVLTEHVVFDPATSTRTFRILGSDYFSSMLMPQLSQTILSAAPHVLLQFLDGGPRAMPHVISDGDVDLTLCPPIAIPEWAASKVLFTSRLVAAAASDGPLQKSGIKAGETIPLDLFCALPQVICSTDGGLSTAVDSALQAKGRKRQIVLTLPHFQSVALALARGHLIGALPLQFAHLAAPQLDLMLYELPVGYEDLDMAMYWHRRYDDDRAHIWLRDQVAAVLAGT